MRLLVLLVLSSREVAVVVSRITENAHERRTTTTEVMPFLQRVTAEKRQGRIAGEAALREVPFHRHSDAAMARHRLGNLCAAKRGLRVVNLPAVSRYRWGSDSSHCTPRARSA